MFDKNKLFLIVCNIAQFSNRKGFLWWLVDILADYKRVASIVTCWNEKDIVLERCDQTSSCIFTHFRVFFWLYANISPSTQFSVFSELASGFPIDVLNFRGGTACLANNKPSNAPYPWSNFLWSVACKHNDIQHNNREHNNSFQCYSGAGCNGQCSGHGTCIGGACKCDVGYWGDLCQVKGCPGTTVSCSGHGVCNAVDQVLRFM